MTFTPPATEGGILRKDAYFEATGYFPHDAQKDVHYDHHRHRVLSNGRRWGKTLLGGKECEPTAFLRNRLGEPQRGWIIGPNYIDCEKEFRVIYDSLKKLGVDTVSHKFLKNVENGNMHIQTAWGWDLDCRSAATPESLVGEGLDFVLLAEAGRLHRSTFTEYVRPALSDKRGWSLMSGVPEISADISLLYWGYRRGLDTSDKKPWKSWRMPSWTNDIVFPGGRNDPEILEAEEDLTQEEFRRQYGGEFIDKVGRVMKEWDDAVHLRKIVFNPDWPVYAAVDFGFTNYWVWLWIQVDNFNRVYVIGEHYFLEQDTDEIARFLVNHPWMSGLVAFYPDPHNPDDVRILERILKKPARLNTGGEVQTRTALVRKNLKPMPPDEPPENQTANIVVDFSCKQLAWEMREGYRWPRHKTEQKNSTELPMDKDNHGPEALSRFIYGYFSIVDEKIQLPTTRRAVVGRRRGRVR
jgi:hypothetical protein